MSAVSRTVSIIVGATLTGMVWTGSAWAESWLQIEAKPSLAQAEARARDWAGMFPDVAGFRMATGWYAIALGPFADDQSANDRRQVLRREGLIPRDSYISDGGNYGQQFWPVGASFGGVTPPGTPPATDLPTPPDQGTVQVQDLPQADTPAPEAQPDPQAVTQVETLAESRRREANLTRSERMDIQSALEWEGQYAGAIDGIFGAGTRSSIADWQMKNGFEPTGVLSSAQQMKLMDTVATQRAALGLQPVEEKEAGISIELPLGLVQFARYNPPFVTYAPKDGSGVQVLLISQPGDQARLRGLYDAMQTLEVVPLDGDRSLRGDSFTIEGQNAKVHSYTQATLSKGLIKGFTLVWPVGDDARMSRVLEAMKSSFRPVGTTTLDSTLGQPMSVSRAALMAGIEKRAPIFARSGFYIDAQGHVLTAGAGLSECGRVTVDDHPADLSVDAADAGFAVLTPRDQLSPKQVAKFRPDAPQAGSQIAVAGFSYPEALPAPVLNFGTLTALKGLGGETGQARLEAQTRKGDVGGPVLDGSGAVVGMLLPVPGDDSRVLPKGLTVALQAGAMAPDLAAKGFAPEASGLAIPRAPEELQKLARGMVVQVTCWK